MITAQYYRPAPGVVVVVVPGVVGLDADVLRVSASNKPFLYWLYSVSVKKLIYLFIENLVTIKNTNFISKSASLCAISKL